MKYPILVGVDYSMTSPGICVFDSSKEEFCFKNCKFHFATDKKKLACKTKYIEGFLLPAYETQEERFMNLAEWAVSTFPSGALVCLENYAYGKAGSGMVFSIGENTGTLKATLRHRGSRFTVISPMQTRQTYLDNGHASKKQVYEQFRRDDPEGFKILNSVLDVKVTEKIVEQKMKNGQTKRKCKGTVSSPASDIVDAYYLCKYLASNG